MTHWGKLGFTGQDSLPHRVSPGSLPPQHPWTLHPFAPPALQCSERGSPSACMLAAGRVWGDPHKVSADLGAEAPGEAQQSFASAMPSPPSKASGMASRGIPRPSLLAACHAEGTAQKQPASLPRNPASVSIATVRDGGTHHGPARPVSCVPTHPCHPTSRTGCGWVSHYLPGGGRRPPAQPLWGCSRVGGGTWGPVTGRPGSSTNKVQSAGTVLSFQSE